MRAVTISAERRPRVSCRQLIIVDAIQCLGVIIEVTPLTDFILGDIVFSQARNLYLRVRIAADGIVAIGA